MFSIRVGLQHAILRFNSNPNNQYKYRIHNQLMHNAGKGNVATP